MYIPYDDIRNNPFYKMYPVQSYIHPHLCMSWNLICTVLSTLVLMKNVTWTVLHSFTSLHILKHYTYSPFYTCVNIKFNLDSPLFIYIFACLKRKCTVLSTLVLMKNLTCTVLHSSTFLHVLKSYIHCLFYICTNEKYNRDSPTFIYILKVQSFLHL